MPGEPGDKDRTVVANPPGIRSPPGKDKRSPLGNPPAARPKGSDKSRGALSTYVYEFKERRGSGCK